MEYVFIINPVAGKTDCGKQLEPSIRTLAAQRGIKPTILRTSFSGHAREITERYAKTGKPVYIYACGGDGTLNEVVQGAVGHLQVAVGCIPCGSGNDYVRNFGDIDSFRDVAAQLTADTACVDVIATDYGYSVDICAAGLDAQVAYGIPKFRRLPWCGGDMAYTLSIAQTFFSRLYRRMTVKVDDEEFCGDYMMTAICNGRLYGGGYLAAPYACMDDGILDVVLVKPIPRHKVVGFLSAYKVGGHLLKDGSVHPDFADFMQVFRAKQVDITVQDKRPLIVTVDGECTPTKTLHAEIQPGQLNVLLPQSIAGRTAVVGAAMVQG